MLIAQDLIWFRLVCWSHRTSCSPRMLIAQDLISFFIFYFPGLTSECRFGWDLKLFENFDSSEFIFFLPEGLSEVFIWCKTLLHSAFILQIGKHVSDAVCMIVHEWDAHALVSLLCFFFSSNFPLSCLCILCRPVGVVPLSPVLGKISILILACRIVSYSSFLETFLFKPFSTKQHGFSSLRSGLYHSCVVNRFRMNNEKLLMQMQLI